MSDSLLDLLYLTSITEEAAAAIEQRTGGQAANPAWFEERSNRLCSSTFGRICKATKATNFSKLATELASPAHFTSASTEHGREHEAGALYEYEKETNSSVLSCGLFVSTSHPYLAASPDGIVSDSLLVEVKCPYGARHRPISPLTVPYLFETDDGVLLLDTRHEYFYQIQGQLFATNRKSCHLVIYTLGDIKIVVVDRDDIFIDHMVMRLEAFFQSFFVQAIKDKFMFHGYRNYDFN